MLMLLRHLLAILILPFLVVGIVPWALRRGSPASFHGHSWFHTSVGVILLAAGLVLFAWTVGLFARVARGTLAPWDPARHLVAVGPYRYMRNPMISGVGLMLVGEVVLFRSRAIGLWALGFLAVNHLYFVLSEEPGLEQRFGDAYRTYKAHVPRWIPRRHPWVGSRS